MAPRSSWKGYLKLSLVSVPVKAYTATGGGTHEIHLNQLHEECHRRIKYQKTCPLHGPVGNDEIVSGYEYAKDQYVVIDIDELKKLRPGGDRAIEIDTFIPADQIDPSYHSGKTYYLVPEGAVGQKPYRLIRQSLEDEQLHAIGEAVISNRERLVLIRPIEKLLAMTVLQHKADVKTPSAFEDEIAEGETSSQELKLTKQLIAGLVRDDFDLGDYSDRYLERLSALVSAKVEGEELVSAPEVEEPTVINLMDALKASLKQIPVPTKTQSKSNTARKTGEKPAAKPQRKVAASTTKRTTKKPTKRRTG